MSENELEWIVVRKSDLEKCYAIIETRKSDNLKTIRADSFRELSSELRKIVSNENINILEIGIDYDRILEKPKQELF